MNSTCCRTRRQAFEFLCRRHVGGNTPYPYGGVATGSDQYANWYRQNIDDIQNAAVANGYGPVISGVGSQYYAIRRK